MADEKTKKEGSIEYLKGRFKSLPLLVQMLAIGASVAGITYEVLEQGLGDIISPFIDNALAPSEATQLALAKDQTLWEQLKEVGFVVGEYTDRPLGTLPDAARSQMLTYGGFDVPDGVNKGHWEIKWAKDGTVEDVFRTHPHQLGVGPEIIEDPDELDKNERWDWNNIKSDRNITESEYAAAKAYFESEGDRPYVPGTAVKTHEALALLHDFKQHGVTVTDAKIILAHGGLVDENGIAYEIWNTDKGLKLHQVPDQMGTKYPHLTPNGLLTKPDGTLITLKGK
jgi:hypothetical protein